MAFVMGSAISAYLLCSTLAVLIADATSSTAAGIVTGVAGAGILGSVGVQLLRTLNSQAKVQAAQIERHVTEIERVTNELERERTRSEQLVGVIAELRSQLAESRGTTP